MEKGSKRRKSRAWRAAFSLLDPFFTAAEWRSYQQVVQLTIATQ